VNPSLGATDAIPGVGPPLRPVPGASRYRQLRLPDTDRAPTLASRMEAKPVL